MDQGRCVMNDGAVLARPLSYLPVPSQLKVSAACSTNKYTKLVALCKP
jgi:hypothetical protein